MRGVSNLDQILALEGRVENNVIQGELVAVAAENAYGEKSIRGTRLSTVNTHRKRDLNINRDSRLKALDILEYLVNPFCNYGLTDSPSYSSGAK